MKSRKATKLTWLLVSHILKHFKFSSNVWNSNCCNWHCNILFQCNNICMKNFIHTKLIFKTHRSDNWKKMALSVSYSIEEKINHAIFWIVVCMIVPNLIKFQQLLNICLMRTCFLCDIFIFSKTHILARWYLLNVTKL